MIFFFYLFLVSTFQHHGQLSPSESGTVADNEEATENLFYYLLTHTMTPLLFVVLPVISTFLYFLCHQIPTILFAGLFSFPS